MRISAVAKTALAAGLLIALAPSCARPAPAAPPTAASPARSATAPTATGMPPDRRVGAVFLGGGDLHTCSGAVLDSAGGDLILTAAHCVAEGLDTNFVAGLLNDAPAQDVWHMDAVYLDPRWVANQDPLADFAIARVSRDAGGTIQAQAGGGLTLGPAPKPGTVVTVTGYALGEGGGPIGCQGATAPAATGFPSFPCAALVDGLSGAPWIIGSTVVGLIGGLDGGGCDENVSYSPPFDDAIRQLLARAEAGGPADVAPTAFGDDCS
ncbi:trypsin-like serine peptidase [Mycobacterium sp. MMS18-G62]